MIQLLINIVVKKSNFHKLIKKEMKNPLVLILKERSVISIIVTYIINHDFLLCFNHCNNILTIASLKYNKSLTNIFE